MKKLIKLVQEYFQNTYSFKLYFSIVALLTVLLSINYTFKVEKEIVNSFSGTLTNGLLLAIITSFGYLATCWLIYFFTKPKDNFFISVQFWLSFLFIMTVYGLYRGAYFEKYAYAYQSQINHLYYYFKTFNEMENLVIGVTPLLIFYLIFDKKRLGHFYGLQSTNLDFKPYLLMLILMAIPIYFASQTESFLNTYPKAIGARFQEVAAIDRVSPFWTLFKFELFYLGSFLSVELMFRGFMIYRMEKYLGEYVVLPMMVTYAIIHFGKPLGETIGSIGGGYILGILALKTRNIYGGIFIHIGVAMLMEIFAFLHS